MSTATAAATPAAISVVGGPSAARATSHQHSSHAAVTGTSLIGCTA